ncbi:flippase [Bacillus massiliigorillae]|uniref:flippase n=1 Tax=Bacillus massiliigorillae TaxID=1243664 RepID=UPI0003A464BF|nr:flippase [Bacillus massiliigorillae]
MSVKKNYIYTLFYQLLNIAFPLITVPYVSRVLGANGVGTYAFTDSLVQYFILFGMLGIATYGSRIIATVRDHKEKLSQTFLSLYALQLTMTALCIILYLLFTYYGSFTHKTIMYIQGIALLSSLVDCTWFFSGLEKFKQIVIRNTIVRFLSLFLLFLLVKTSNDLPIYTVIMTGTTFIGQMVLWFGMKNYIRLIPIKIMDILVHFKPIITYFVPQIAIQIYFVLNKTMIGIFSTESEVGIFDYADKILKVSLAFITSLGTIMLPKMAYIFSNGKIEEVRKYMFKSLDFSSFIAIPIMLGLMGISSEFIPWYLGEEFKKSITVLLIISPTIFFMAWSGVFGTQYMLAVGRMKPYTLSVYGGAIVNFILNLLFINRYGAIGASIGTLFAEFFVMIVQLIAIREQIEFKKIFFKVFHYGWAGTVMFLVVRIIGSFFGVKISTTILQIVAGALTYLSLILIIESIKREGLLLNELKRLIDGYKQT